MTPRRTHVALLSIALIVSAFQLWRSPYEASCDLIIPDGVEYAVGAQRIATLGTYDIVVDGKPLPPRYPPMFSSVLSPAYLVFPNEIGAGMLVVYGFALACVAAFYFLGNRIAGPIGGAACIVVLMYQPGLVWLARMIMTDFPVISLLSIVLLLFFRLWDRWSLPTLLAAGILIAIAVGFRPLCIFALAPFAVLSIARRRVNIFGWLVLFAPVLLVILFNALYNHRTFGDWRRSGYHFWCPLPYEFNGLVFSIRYLPQNLKIFLQPTMAGTVLAGAAGLLILWRARAPFSRALALFAACGIAPISLLHLLYAFPDYRFHAPLLAVCCIAAGGAVATIISKRRIVNTGWIAAVFAVALCLTPWTWDRPPDRRGVAERFAREMPVDGVLITRLDPVFLEPIVLRGTSRVWIAASRDQEYADKLIAPRPIDTTRLTPDWPSPHRSAQLLRAGAVEAVAATALERIDEIHSLARAGAPVFVDAASLRDIPALHNRLIERFDLIPTSPNSPLYRLLAK